MEGIVCRGIGVSPGVAIGPALVLERRRTPVSRQALASDQIGDELKRLEEAVIRAQEDLRALKRQTREELGASVAQIFDAQLLMLEDPMFIGEITKRVLEQRQNSEWAVRRVGENLSNQLASISDVYLRERGTDIDDLQERLLRALLGEEGLRLEGLEQPVVLFAHDLTPSETAQLDVRRIIGFATDIGGRTSHTAIVARSLEIPAVVGLHDVTTMLQANDTVVLDGDEGLVMVRPSSTMLGEYENKQVSFSGHQAELLATRDLPAETPDGFRVKLTANIETSEEVTSALSHGAEGIGLYRSEFLYLRRPGVLPTEEEHYREYRSVLERMSPHPVNIRILDIGGEKLLPGDPSGQHQTNALLGLRALRLALRERELFSTQLRGLLRASIHGKLRIMLPFVSGVEELRQAKLLIEELREALEAEGSPVASSIPLGVMVEVPGAALIADLLASEVEFFTIGSNDLIQYLLAVDRTNDAVAHLYQPLHPAVLRLLRDLVEVAKDHETTISMCGEMAADPLNALVLLGFGINELSMNVVAIPLIKSVIRRVKRSEAERILQHALQLKTAQEVEEFVFEQLMALFPDGFMGRK
ncbi:MAG: phosphoenolpyruvate--protein phosphotransferase [Acidobacteriota bacterium]